MTRPIRPSYTPPTVPHPRASDCARGCCWSPYQGLCARNHRCTCHTGGIQ